MRHFFFRIIDIVIEFRLQLILFWQENVQDKSIIVIKSTQILSDLRDDHKLHVLPTLVRFVVGHALRIQWHVAQQATVVILVPVKVLVWNDVSIGKETAGVWGCHVYENDLQVFIFFNFDLELEELNRNLLLI